MKGLKLGWVDFSKEQRKKVMSVMDLLRVPEAIDELGIGIIRDAFANRFFPGTTTIQTRAKYFLIVPYLLYELENGKLMTGNEMISKLEEEELKLIDVLKEDGETGIIGQVSGDSLKRKPSSIYWSGIRKYEIFNGGNASLNDYARGVYVKKKENLRIKSQANIKNKNEDDEGDDPDAISSEFGDGFWRLPTYHENWRKGLTIHLTLDEAKFLRRKVISSCPDSLIAFILQEKHLDFCMFNNFEEIEGIINMIPKKIREDYFMARSFADFIKGAHIRYNMILSKEENEKLNSEWREWYYDIEQNASLNLEKIFTNLNVRNRNLKIFLQNSRLAMMDKDINKLDEIIVRRERDLKGISRAKLCNVSEFEYKEWVGIDKLDYRLQTGQTIIKDIFEGLGE